METLKKEKNNKCKAYEMMSGKKMLELKKNCEQILLISLEGY